MAGAGAPPNTLADVSSGERIPSSVQNLIDLRDARRARNAEPEQDEPEQPEESPAGPRHLKGEFDENLALKLDDFTLAKIASDVLQGIEQDIKSRVEWSGIAEKAIEYLGLKIEAASSEVTPEGSVSRVFHTLLLESTVYFWANAHAELLPASGPAKVKDDAPPEPKAQNPNPQPAGGMPPPVGGNAPPETNRGDLAAAFEQDLNHYLTAVDRQYYRDFSRMLFSLGPMGTEFRKVYWCPLRKRPVSEWIKGQNLIVSNEAVSLQTAARVTEKNMVRHATMKRMQVGGWWRDATISAAPQQSSDPVDVKAASVTGISLSQSIPADFLHTTYESYCEYDIPGYEHEDEDGVTGLPLPYRITIDKDSRQVLEIRRNWKENDQNLQARQRYVMYGMVPGLGFYYLGFIHILGNTQRALTAIERQMIDTGQMANFPGFLFAKGALRPDSNEIRVPPGGGKEVNVGDKPIGNVVMPLPYKDVSPGLLKLMEMLVSDGRKLSSIAEMPVGEGRADVPVGTVVAMIEQTTKVMNAVHKGLHASMQEELLLLKELFAEDPTALWAFAKSPARKWEQAEEFSDVELVPASDPNIPSQLHRTMQAMALFQVGQQAAPLGILNMQEILERIFRTLNVPNIDALFENPTQMPQAQGQGQPPPDPAKMAKVQMDAVDQQRKAANEAQQAQLQQREMVAKLADAAQDRQSKVQIAAMNAQSARERLQAQLQMHADKLSHDERQAILGHVMDFHQARQDSMDNELDRQASLQQASMKPPPSGGSNA